MLWIARDVWHVSFRGVFDLPNNDISLFDMATRDELVAAGIGEG